MNNHCLACGAIYKDTAAADQAPVCPYCGRCHYVETDKALRQPKRRLPGPPLYNDVLPDEWQMYSDVVSVLDAVLPDTWAAHYIALNQMKRGSKPINKTLLYKWLFGKEGGLPELYGLVAPEGEVTDDFRAQRWIAITLCTAYAIWSSISPDGPPLDEAVKIARTDKRYFSVHRRLKRLRTLLRRDLKESAKQSNAERHGTRGKGAG